MYKLRSKMHNWGCTKQGNTKSDRQTHSLHMSVHPSFKHVFFYLMMNLLFDYLANYNHPNHLNTNGYILFIAIVDCMDD